MTTFSPHLYHVVHLSYICQIRRGEDCEPLLRPAVDATGDDGLEQRFRLLRSVGEECATSDSIRVDSTGGKVAEVG